MAAEAIACLAGFLVGFVAVLSGLSWSRARASRPLAAGPAPVFEPVPEQLPTAATRATQGHAGPPQAVVFEPIDPDPFAAALPCWVCGKPKNIGNHAHN